MQKFIKLKNQRIGFVKNDDTIVVGYPVLQVPVKYWKNKIKKMDVFEKFVLKFFKAEKKDAEGIAELLGVHLQLIKDTISKLKPDFIKEDESKNLKITDKGKQALQDELFQEENYVKGTLLFDTIRNQFFPYVFEKGAFEDDDGSKQNKYFLEPEENYYKSGKKLSLLQPKANFTACQHNNTLAISKGEYEPDEIEDMEISESSFNTFTTNELADKVYGVEFYPPKMGKINYIEIPLVEKYPNRIITTENEKTELTAIAPFTNKKDDLLYGRITRRADEKLRKKLQDDIDFESLQKFENYEKNKGSIEFELSKKQANEYFDWASEGYKDEFIYGQYKSLFEIKSGILKDKVIKRQVKSGILTDATNEIEKAFNEIYSDSLKLRIDFKPILKLKEDGIMDFLSNLNLEFVEDNRYTPDSIRKMAERIYDLVNEKHNIESKQLMPVGKSGIKDKFIIAFLSLSLVENPDVLNGRLKAVYIKLFKEEQARNYIEHLYQFIGEFRNKESHAEMDWRWIESKSNEEYCEIVFKIYSQLSKILEPLNTKTTGE